LFPLIPPFPFSPLGPANNETSAQVGKELGKH
jgi:hypothetical protein